MGVFRVWRPPIRLHRLLVATALPLLLAVAPVQVELAAAESPPAVDGAGGGTIAETTLVGWTSLTNSTVMGESFARLQDRLDGPVGIAVAPIGGGRVITYGTWRTGDAWSTMKVPIAVAAARAGDAGVNSDIEAAITLSDNDAARRLWDGLAGTVPPVATVESVLAETGDHTPLGRQMELQGDDSFGNLDWSLTDQVAFTSRFPCLPGGGRVVGEMRRLTEEHRWGLAAAGAAAKGGWGADANGDYLVRQLGIIDTPTGRSAVTIAAQPTSGLFEDGTQMLTAITAWVAAHRGELPAGRCPAVSR